MDEFQNIEFDVKKGNFVKTYLGAMSAVLLVSACSSGDNGGGNSRSHSEEMFEVEIGSTHLEQIAVGSDLLSCNVAFEVTNTGSERIGHVGGKFSVVNSSGDIIADGIFGINNLMPGKSQSVKDMLSRIACADIAGFKNISARNASFKASPKTKLPIEI